MAETPVKMDWAQIPGKAKDIENPDWGRIKTYEIAIS